MTDVFTGEGFYLPEKVPVFDVSQAQEGTAWWQTSHGIDLERGKLTQTISGPSNGIILPGEFDPRLKHDTVWALSQGSFDIGSAVHFSMNEAHIDGLGELSRLVNDEQQQSAIADALQMLREVSRTAEEQRLRTRLAEIGGVINKTKCLWMCVAEESKDEQNGKIVARVAPIVGMTAIVERHQATYGTHLRASIEPVLKGRDGQLGRVEKDVFALDVYTFFPNKGK